MADGQIAIGYANPLACTAQSELEKAAQDKLRRRQQECMERMIMEGTLTLKGYNPPVKGTDVDDLWRSRHGWKTTADIRADELKRIQAEARKSVPSLVRRKTATT